MFIAGSRQFGQQPRTRFIKGMLDERYPQATKVRVVMDNLNALNTASLQETFPPEGARCLTERLESTTP
jgi:hypothetical protein